LEMSLRPLSSIPTNAGSWRICSKCTVLSSFWFTQVPCPETAPRRESANPRSASRRIHRSS
jgi:hypothetical protein